jgi:general nucleoside transport system permease protein
MKDINNKIYMSFRETLNALKQPVIATVFGLLIGAIIIFFAKENPIVIYAQLFEKSFFKPYYLMQSLSRATPIIICAIATAAAWRAGYINIGVEGQMIVGGFVATVCAIFVPGPPILVMLISIAVGMIAGALYAMIAAVLNIKYNVSIVICTLMMNYIANFITSYFVSFPLKDTSGDGLALQTVTINEGMRFLKLSSRSNLNFGFIIAILIVILFMFIEKKTTFGYESKMTGFNPLFSKYGGVKQNKIMLKTMALSGAIASMAGVVEVFGVKYRFIDGMLTSTSYAWTGLMSALISALNPIGMFFTSIFLSGLQLGGQSIQRTSNVPLEMATVIQSCITLFVSVKITMDFVKRRKVKKRKLENIQSKGAITGGE